MMKRGKLFAYLAAFLGGTTVFSSCANSFWSGWLRRGFVGEGFNWLDAITDWLNEDLFG
jgi:hypothetical protein